MREKRPLPEHRPEAAGLRAQQGRLSLSEKSPVPVTIRELSENNCKGENMSLLQIRSKYASKIYLRQ